MTEIIVIALILNEISVSSTHMVLGESHLHWSHKPWWIKWNQRHDYVDGALLITYRYYWLNWFHVFSALRWPLLLAVAWPMGWQWWIGIAVVLKCVWWVVKKAFRKDWKSITNPF